MKRIISLILIVTIISDMFAPLLVYAAGDIDLSACSASNYKVSAVRADGQTDLGCYSSYSNAKSAMLNYQSDANNVAVIYNNNRIVNATYAIAKLDIKSTASTTTLIYPSVDAPTRYTYVAGWYGSDAAFIDYDESGSYKRAKIMISGYTGWVNIDELRIVPLSLLSDKNISITTSYGIKLRSNPTTSVDNQIGSVPCGATVAYQGSPYIAEGYTWYKVSYGGKTGWIATQLDWVSFGSGLQTYYEAYSPTGNLIHYFDTKVSGKVFTNLATYPHFMTSGGKYYSFDGNYFYTNLVTMLNDYRNGIYNNAINKDIPYYNYFMYLPTRTRTGYTAADFDKIITDEGYTQKPNPAVTYYDINNGNNLVAVPNNVSAMVGSGQYFINGQNQYGTNALLAFSAALNESGYGRNSISIAKNNIFSVGASDSNPFTGATTYSSVEAAIISYMSDGIAARYADPAGQYYYGSHYGNKASGRNVNYASDPYWGEKAADGYADIDRDLLWREFNSSKLGIKQTNADVSVKKSPANASDTLYVLKNNYFGKSVSNMSVVILDSIRGENINGNDIWYKIQSDMSLDALGNQVIDGSYNYGTSVGYVHSSYIYSTKDNPPIVNASDRTVIIGQSIDLKAGITATDREDGDLTSYISEAGTVDFNTVGIYPITYTVGDSSGNVITKNITINVTDQYQIKEGNFYLDQMSWNDTNKTLDVTGSLTMKNMNNDLDTDIKYELVLTNQNTNNTITKPIARLTNETEFPLPINGEGIYTYKYSWFKDSISLNDIPSGDYSAKIVAKADANKTELAFTNTFNKAITSKAIEDSRGYYFRVDTSSFMAPIDFIIRENGLISSTVAPTKNNMIVDYTNIGFEGTKLNIRGTAFSVKGDYNSNINVERQIILENIDTFTRKEAEIGYIDNGDYQVRLVVDDGLSKQRAWYDGGIDLSDLPAGRYAIYINTKTGTVEDYGELSDMFNRTLSETLDLGDRTAKLELNKSKRKRIELIIEAK